MTETHVPTDAPASRRDLLTFLDGLNITYTVHEHPPVFTVEEAQRHTAHLPGGHCKNLFLKDKKGQLWLITCEDQRPVDLKTLKKHLGAAQLSFGKAELLHEVLGVIPGAVTPLALRNDRGDQRIRPVFDQALLRHSLVNCHPLENTATISLSPDDLLRFVEACGHTPITLDFDAPANEDQP